MSEQTPFYVTTPIYYVNDRPHVGHAYTTLAADTLARWHHLKGAPAYSLTGTDEHGQKIEQAASKAGVTPQEHADRYSAPFREMVSAIGAEPNDFIRTTEERHKTFVHQLWRAMRDAGDIYLGKYEGWYSVSDEAYFTEDELVDGKAPTGSEVTWMVEESYFFRLSKYGEALLAHIEANPRFIQPQSRANEIKRFVEGGLQDISISRSNFSWGIPVPDDDKHVIYVWVDALSNYISALGGTGSELYQRFWSESCHLIGKDILRFHAVYWPCFLMSAGLPLPKSIFAHGWWTVEGEKMSKSKGNAIDPHAAVKAVGADAFRYFLLREISFGSDGDFSQSALLTRVNSDLANDYGNLLNRTLGMLGKYRASVTPSQLQPQGGSDLVAFEAQLLEAHQRARADLDQAMSELRFHDALRAIWSLVSAGNKYVDQCAPWTLAKAGEERASELDRALYNLCELLRVVGIWTLPFLPTKAVELLEALRVSPEGRTWEQTKAWGQLPFGVELAKPNALFPRLEGPLLLTRAAVEAASAPATAPASSSASSKSTKGSSKPAKASEPASEDAEPVAFDDFLKLHIKVAQVLTAERHPNADRLLVLTLDAGEAEPRTVCAGIASAYEPADLVGARVALLSNLTPRKIRGVVSQGMLLAAGEGEGVRLMSVDPTVPVGSRVS